MGAIVLELYYECAVATSSIRLMLVSHAPRTCENFATLAERGLYSNTLWHRLVRVGLTEASLTSRRCPGSSCPTMLRVAAADLV